MGFRVGVDVGGTFTDIVIYDDSNKSFSFNKVLTNVEDIPETIVNGLKDLITDFNLIDFIVYATTIGTNLLFEQERLYRPKVALLTTKGFKDVIEIGRQNRPNIYDPLFTKPKPLIRRKDRYEVDERIDSTGRVIRKLSKKDIYTISRLIMDKYDIIAISFLNSHLNPINERKCKEILKRICPNIKVVISSDINPDEGEYERTTTTVLNAILIGVLSRHLSDLVDRLRQVGYKDEIYIMQSNGGIATVEYAVKYPAAFIESGPAAGVIAAAYYSKILGDQQVVSFDMGGTTAKASAIISGEPLITYEYEVGGEIHHGRLVKGSGYPVRLPFIDIVEVGAGGGTIAWIDKGGALRVGPKSMGSNPGPASYGLGGDRLTITDANLILGRIGKYLANGRIILDKNLAILAANKISATLGIDAIEVSSGVINIANTIMAKALRIVTVERGLNPSETVLYAFGGAGPLHAAELADIIGIKRVIIPPNPGLFSAVGLIISDFKFEYRCSLLKTSDLVDDENLSSIFNDLLSKAERDADKLHGNSYYVLRKLEMRYKGQSNRIPIFWRGSLKKAVEDFHKIHAARYGFMSLEDPVEIASIKLIFVVVKSKIEFKRKRVIKDVPKSSAEREVYYNDNYFKVNIYERRGLKPGMEIEGPAVIEEYSSTTFVPHHYKAIIDEFENIVLERV